MEKYIGETEKNLHLSSRNLKGVELIAGNAVHPYHLLRYSSAVFSRAALEKLQDSLKATAPKRKHSGGGVMKSAYQIIRRPVITEKGLGVKETEATLVFEVSSKASKTEIKNAVQSIFKVGVELIAGNRGSSVSSAALQHCGVLPRGAGKTAGLAEGDCAQA